MWGLHQVTAAVRRWRSRAEQIPSDAIRADALYALTNKRTHADGAALFSILPSRRKEDLLHLLVEYELILDFLDNVSERHRTEVNGHELHLALIEAVDTNCTPSDYYRYHPWKDDGGYLAALVESCQQRCRMLPSYEEVRPFMLREARRTQVLALNHLPDPTERDAALRRWAATHCPDEDDFSWYELGGAASASLVVLVLLTLAAQKNLSLTEVERTRRVYWPRMSLVAVMLDSFADQLDDANSGDHSYVSHYPSREVRVDRLAECIRQASLGALGLSNGRKHAIIASSMVAMYLSKDCLSDSYMTNDTQVLKNAGGSLVGLLYPVLRLWRRVYSQQSA